MYDLHQLINLHIQRRPAMLIQDVYKLLFQGVFGADHLINDPERACANLVYEYETKRPDHYELLLEIVSMDGSLVRVNLRPFRALKGDIQLLTNVFLESAAQRKGTVQEFAKFWQYFMYHTRGYYQMNESEEQLQTFNQRVCSQDYPPVHHSESYRRWYKPSYRVVRLDLFERYFLHNKSNKI